MTRLLLILPLLAIAGCSPAPVADAAVKGEASRAAISADTEAHPFAASAPGDVQPVAAKTVVEGFATLCANSMPRLDAIEAQASLMAFRPIPPEMASVMVPAEANSSFKGWLAEFKGQRFLLGVSEPPAPSTDKVCSVSVGTTDWQGVKSELEAAFALEPVFEETQAYQTHRLWKAVVNGNRAVVSLRNSTDPAVKAVTVAIIVES